MYFFFSDSYSFFFFLVIFFWFLLQSKCQWLFFSIATKDVAFIDVAAILLQRLNSVSWCWSWTANAIVFFLVYIRRLRFPGIQCDVLNISRSSHFSDILWAVSSRCFGFLSTSLVFILFSREGQVLIFTFSTKRAYATASKTCDFLSCVSVCEMY